MKFSLLIFLFFVLIFELILCRVFVKRRKRNLNDFENKPSLSYSIEYPEQLNAKLIFCDQKTTQFNYCVFINKFRIAGNQSFDDCDQHLGIIASLPEIDTYTDEFNISKLNISSWEPHYLYLTTHSTEEYTFLEEKQLTSMENCQRVKQ